MPEQLVFESRAAFRAWLEENCLSDKGVWLVFGKKGGPQTITSAEALEEALCFGWVDGQMQSIDDTQYIKYFKQRNTKSNWSEKNKKLAAKLEAGGRISEFGHAKILAAKENGCWQASPPAGLSPEQIEAFQDLLQPHPEAYENYQRMTPSVRKTYARAYFSGAKTEAGKEKNLDRIIQRLARNLNPMESLQKALDKGK